MGTRIHIVLAEEEKSLLERAARNEGMSLSAWLRMAAREKLEGTAPPSLDSEGELSAFFAECDLREVGREPDWSAHMEVIEKSQGQGIPDP